MPASESETKLALLGPAKCTKHEFPTLTAGNRYGKANHHKFLLIEVLLLKVLLSTLRMSTTYECSTIFAALDNWQEWVTFIGGIAHRKLVPFFAVTNFLGIMVRKSVQLANAL